MTYFRLHPDCYCVDGRNGSVLYDITRRRIFILDRRAAELLRRCEQSAPLRDEDRDGEGGRFLDTMVEEELGGYYSHPVYIEPFLLHSPFKGIGLLGAHPGYRVVSWSITDQCEHDCDHCPHVPSEGLSWSACRSCVRADRFSEDSALFERVDRIVRQLANLGFKRLHVRGGNPLLAWERLVRIVDSAAAYPSFAVVVMTPGTGRPVDDIVRLTDRPNVSLNVVLRGWRAAGNGTSVVADVSPDQALLLDALQERRKAPGITINVAPGVPARTAVSHASISERWGVKPVCAEFYPFPIDGAESVKFLTLDNDAKPLFTWRNQAQFFSRTERTTCLDGTMELAVDGSIRPCAGCGDTCGRVENHELSAALKGGTLYGLWRMPKQAITTCKDCALRLACVDCFAAERAGATNPRIAAGYCGVADGADLYESSSRFRQDGSQYLLSLRKGIEPCPTQQRPSNP